MNLNINVEIDIKECLKKRDYTVKQYPSFRWFLMTIDESLNKIRKS